MARAIRVQYPGACYHVINRGNYRRNLFEDAGAAEAFVRTLAEAATRYHWRIHAYVVMRNHFHLALQISEPNLSEGMQWLQGTWALRFNGYRRMVGRPFQGRFKAILTEPGHAFAQVCHYVHLNPIRAGVVNFATYATFRYSSYLAFRSKRRASWLDDTTIRAETGIDDSSEGWESYIDFLEILSTDPIARREMTSRHLSRGWCLGNAEFKKSAAAEVHRRLGLCRGAQFEGFAPAGIRQAKEASWSHRLEQFAAAAGIQLARLPPANSAPAKVLLAAAMKRSTSVSNAWICSELSMGAPAGLSVHIRRWERIAKNIHRLENLLRVVT